MDKKTVHLPGIVPGGCLLFLKCPVWTGYFRRNRRKGERYYDIAHPINQEVRDKLTKAVLEKYEEAEDPEPVEKTESEDAE